MASITIGTAAFDALLSSVRKQVERSWGRQRDAAAESAEFGAKTAQSYTKSRPGATTGKAGRVETGEMVAALRHRERAYTPDLIRYEYGFVDDYELYFRAQTVTGFSHNRSGKHIAPTFALRDSIGPTNDFARGAAGRA